MYCSLLFGQMNLEQHTLSNTFNKFYTSESAGGIILVACTIIALVCANSPISLAYLNFWQTTVGGLSLELWINDAFMAIFFLLIGLELEREFYVGELSQLRNALLPFFAAIGGMIVPAGIHFLFNMGTPTQVGFGIPMATDIAFALAILALLGNRIPPSFKIFLVAYAIIDDIGAILIIATFYTAGLSIGYLAGALALWLFLILLNRRFRVMSILPYVFGGALMWFFMFKSGIHATIAGVMLAFAIPFSSRDEDTSSPSYIFEHFLHKPVAFIIVPLFALANTGVAISAGWMENLASMNSLGILAGLIIGKSFGVTLFCCASVAFGICHLPPDLHWRHIFGAGILGGIGFTMSIFITNLAYAGNPAMINDSKIAILIASLLAGVFGFFWIKYSTAIKPIKHQNAHSHLLP